MPMFVKFIYSVEYLYINEISIRRLSNDSESGAPLHRKSLMNVSVVDYIISKNQTRGADPVSGDLNLRITMGLF